MKSRQGPLILHRMSKDGTAVLDEGKVIAVDAKNVPVLEGPKLYKRHGFYYILRPSAASMADLRQFSVPRISTGPMITKLC